jgi:NADH-quinone oxidoreductase subunit E
VNENGQVPTSSSATTTAQRLPTETYAELLTIAARYPQKRSGLLPMLHLVQASEGRITPAGIEACAEILEISAADVSGVATFYTMYKRRPVGDYLVGVCTNTLCAVMGGDAIFDRLKSHLDIGNDETTPDGKVSLEHIECNAACDYAPVMTVNWEFMDNMTPESAVGLVDELRSGAEVRSTRGPVICSWKQAERVLAGFPDGLADEGPTAGRPSLVGLEIARGQGWTAPDPTAPGAPIDATETVDHAEAKADTSRAESETEVEESPAEVRHEDTVEAKDDQGAKPGEAAT